MNWYSRWYDRNKLKVIAEHFNVIGPLEALEDKGRRGDLRGGACGSTLADRLIKQHGLPKQEVIQFLESFPRDVDRKKAETSALFAPYAQIRDMLSDERRRLSDGLPSDVQKKLRKVYQTAWHAFHADFVKELAAVYARKGSTGITLGGGKNEFLRSVQSF
jgi:hypothetical protein